MQFQNLFDFFVTLITNTEIMETIRVQFEPKIKAKLLELLQVFSTEELQIIQEDPFFEQNKKKLVAELAKIENGTAKYSSFDELNLVLEKRISSYED
jgi:hypothetical protein